MIQEHKKCIFCPGILHLDLHKGNIILNSEGDIKILDFGQSVQIQAINFTAICINKDKVSQNVTQPFCSTTLNSVGWVDNIITYKGGANFARILSDHSYCDWKIIPKSNAILIKHFLCIYLLRYYTVRFPCLQYPLTSLLKAPPLEKFQLTW